MVKVRGVVVRRGSAALSSSPDGSDLERVMVTLCSGSVASRTPERVRALGLVAVAGRVEEHVDGRALDEHLRLVVVDHEQLDELRGAVELVARADRHGRARRRAAHVGAQALEVVGPRSTRSSGTTNRIGCATSHSSGANTSAAGSAKTSEGARRP